MSIPDPAVYACTGLIHPGTSMMYTAWTERTKQDLKGRSKAERERYLKEYIGYSDPPEETPESVAWTHLPEPIKDRIRKIEREVFYLSMFIAREGLWNESQEFLNDNMDNPIPFELEW